MSSLDQALPAALDARQALLNELHQQQTDCYRLFHGSQEGAPGLTVDRYGPQLMVQSFHQPLEREALLALHAQINEHLGHDDLHLVYNDRSGCNSRIDRRDEAHQPTSEALADMVGQEWGLNYRVRGRHPGQDPLLFLDLRNARGWIKANSAGKSVLNLFAYTCGVGLCAAAGGAREVLNLDFAEGNLAVGRENLALNPGLAMDFVQSDYFPAIRQLAGLPISTRRGHKLPSFPRLEQRQFDLILLDPPAWAKSAFGTVDLLRDYQSLLKPAILATADNGTLVCCNNLAKVPLDDWRAQVLRCAEKLGRPVRDCEQLLPAADFPSRDGQPPLKTLILRF